MSNNSIPGFSIPRPDFKSPLTDGEQLETYRFMLGLLHRTPYGELTMSDGKMALSTNPTHSDDGGHILIECDPRMDEPGSSSTGRLPSEPMVRDSELES